MVCQEWPVKSKTYAIIQVNMLSKYERKYARRIMIKYSAGQKKRTAQFCKYLRAHEPRSCMYARQKCTTAYMPLVCMFSIILKYLCNRSSDLYQIWNFRSWHSNELSIQFSLSFIKEHVCMRHKFVCAHFDTEHIRTRTFLLRARAYMHGSLPNFCLRSTLLLWA